MPPHPIKRLLRRSRLRVLGVNTGTSADALDLALVEISRHGHKHNLRLIETSSYRIPDPLRCTLRSLAADALIDKKLASQAHYRLGRWIAACIRQFQSQAPTTARIDLIGCHGQTIGHFPASGTRRRRAGRPSANSSSATWQIGSSAAIAQATGIVTIGDFRAGDIAAGGMGAPLSGYYHYLLFGTQHVVLNLGGIANISAVRHHRRRLEILAFDVGPGNMVIDALAGEYLKRRFDRNGRIAALGKPDPRIVTRALRHPYFRRSPPKTCGREEFGWTAVRRWFGRASPSTDRVSDHLASAVTIATEAIFRAVRRWVEPFTPVRSLVLTGGGTRNHTLVEALQERLTGWRLTDSRELGIPPQYVEPAGFALLAYESLHARPGNLGGATGAQPAVLGTISLPVRRS